MLVGVEYNKKAKGLVITYYGDDGKIKKLIKPLLPEDVYSWKLSDEPSPYLSWDEKPIVKSKTNYLNRYRIEELLLSKLTPKERSIIYGDKWPLVHYIDIETEVNEQNDFPDPEIADFPINLMAIVIKDTIVILSTMKDMNKTEVSDIEHSVNNYFKQYNIKTNYSVKYLYFNDERQLLTTFFHKLLPQINFITGWNVLNFDWQTLYNRAERLGIEQFKNLLSNRTVTQYRVPVHIGILDYMEVCQEFKPIKMAENYTLDYTAETLLGVRKLQHPYSSFYEFQKDVHMFTEYCAIDSCLVQLIEQKKALLEIAYSMANIAELEITKVFGPVFKTELFLCREYYNMGLHMPDIPKHGTREKYPGAYVHPPILGYYHNIGCFDFASQYPNTQMQWYIDPKTYLGKIGNVELNMYNTDEYVVTKYGTVFLKDEEKCASRKIQRKFYDKRFEIKGAGGKLQQIKQQITALKKEKEKLLAM